ncbi:MAG TPA: heme exporter protein CcmD [Thiolapillus brandeum]|uniref:Heme exporter protein D n=1 Tax=Thiolapillus brandeum TaxID=1076588 RepID=A0A831JXS7_9GAMM|nr:heme exporter protein CcmD [Thiolapillus brandeum]
MKEGLSEFFAMGGYALYVWGSFGVTALLMIVEPLLVRQRRKAVIQRVSRLIRLKSEQKS